MFFLPPDVDMLFSAKEMTLALRPSLPDSSLSQLMCMPPSNEEQMEFLSKISRHKPVICSIVVPHSNEFETIIKIISFSSVRDLY
jgi:hypothetical protein